MDCGATERSQAVALKDMLFARCQGKHDRRQSCARAFSFAVSQTQHVLSMTAFVEALIICELDTKVRSAPAYEQFQLIEVAHHIGHCLEYPPIALLAD